MSSGSLSSSMMACADRGGALGSACGSGSDRLTNTRKRMPTTGPCCSNPHKHFKNKKILIPIVRMDNNEGFEFFGLE
jgi:hypothetical protein